MIQNKVFPSYKEIIEILKGFMYTSRLSYLEDDKCITNLLGGLIDLGYDVLKDVQEEGQYSFPLMVRVSEGYIPIQLVINPENLQAIKDQLNAFNDAMNRYTDIPVGFFMTLINARNEGIRLEGNAKYSIKDIQDYYWWGGRLFVANDNATISIRPSWQAKKLSLFNISKQQNVQGDNRE